MTNVVVCSEFQPDDLTILDACAGYGMLGESVLLGLDAIGLRGRVVCHVERDSAAAAALMARMEGSPVDQAPIADDLESFDGTSWRGCVDIFAAGLPCPAFSSAGKRKGNEDHRAFGEDGRGPQFHALRIIGECRPTLVFLENVCEWVTGGSFRRFGDELSGMGYEIKDPLFLAAEDVGAPHKRERVFILAHTGGSDWRSWTERLRMRAASGELGDSRRLAQRAQHGNQSGKKSRGMPTQADGNGIGPAVQELAQRQSGGLGIGGESSGGDGQPLCCGEGMACGEGQAFPAGPGRKGNRPAQPRGRGRKLHAERGVQLGDTEHGAAGHGESRETRDQSKEEWRGMQRTPDGDSGLPLFPPGRGDASNPNHPDWWAWAAVAAVATSAMPRTQQHIPALADGMARADELRIGGNGVVPLAAAYAFATLLDDAIRGRR